MEPSPDWETIVLENVIAPLVTPVPLTLEDVFTQFVLQVAKAPSLVDVNIAAGLALEVLGNITG